MWPENGMLTVFIWDVLHCIKAQTIYIAYYPHYLLIITDRKILLCVISVIWRLELPTIFDSIK